jgi:carbamoyl-phosphate synthase large subunit
MREPARVLLTAAGTATAANVMQALRDSRRFDVHIVAVDQDPLAVGLYLADARAIVPSARDPAYIERIVELCRRERIEFVFPLHSSEIPVFARARALLADAGIGLCIAEPSVAQLCIEKDRFIAFLAGAGFPHPRTYAGYSDVAAYPVFLKPRIGSSSNGTFKVGDREELEFLLRRHPDSLIQEYIDWPELTVDCFVSRSGVLVGCVPRYRRRVKDGKSVVAETAAVPRVVQQVERLLDALALRGPCNVQLFHDGGEGIRFVEVNPRLSAGGLPLATHVGTNIPELMLREDHGEALTERFAVRPGVTMIRYLTELFPGGY